MSRASTGVSAGAIEALLPQTQCARCGHDGCAPYAQALAGGRAAPDRCVPGGDATVRALVAVLGGEAREVDLAGGPPARWRLAVIDEPACIGCALCLDACPVDAIIGARRLTHTVIAADCTGCELCLPVCPVDCIALGADCAAPLPGGHGQVRPGDPRFLAAWLGARADGARSRAARRRERLARRGPRRSGPRSAPRLAPRTVSEAERRALVAGALARARARRP